MTVKKVLRPYTREEVLATLRAKVSTAAPAARSFSPVGLSAASVFASRRAAAVKAAQKATGSASAGRATSTAVFTSIFAANVFSARRASRAPATSSVALNEPASPSHAAVDPVTVEAPRENGAFANSVAGSITTNGALSEAATDAAESTGSFSYAEITGSSSASSLEDVVARACGFGGGAK